MINQAVEEHKRKKMRLVEELRRGDSRAEGEGSAGAGLEELNLYLSAEKESLEYDVAEIAAGVVAVPSQEEVMKLVLEEKKKQLLQQFVF
jgi:predicted CopG family antitoxin